MPGGCQGRGSDSNSLRQGLSFDGMCSTQWITGASQRHFWGGWGTQGSMANELLGVLLHDSTSRFKIIKQITHFYEKIVIVCAQSLGFEQKCKLYNDNTISDSPESHEPITICDNEFWPRMLDWLFFFSILFSSFFIWLGMPWSKV